MSYQKSHSFPHRSELFGELSIKSQTKQWKMYERQKNQIKQKYLRLVEQFLILQI